MALCSQKVLLVCTACASAGRGAGASDWAMICQSGRPERTSRNYRPVSLRRLFCLDSHMPAGILVVGRPFSDRRARAWCKNPPPDKLGVREGTMQAISETRKAPSAGRGLGLCPSSPLAPFFVKSPCHAQAGLGSRMSRTLARTMRARDLYSAQLTMFP